MCVTPNIDLSVTAIGGYHKRYSREIWQHIRGQMVINKITNPVRGVRGQYIMPNYQEGNMIQPFRCPFEPSDLGTFKVSKEENYHIKIDKSIGCLDDLVETFLSQYDELGLSGDDQTKIGNKFYQWLLENHWGDKIAEEIEYASFRGVRNDLGTTYIDSMNGWGTKLQNMISSSVLTPISTGVINAGNIYNKTEGFVSVIPPAAFAPKHKGYLVMSPTMLDMLYYDRITQLGNHTYFTDRNAPFFIGPPNRQVQVIALPGMEGSTMMMYTPRWNFLRMYNEIDGPSNTFSIEQKIRCMHVATDHWTGYGFGMCEYIYVNDQPIGTMPALGSGCPIMNI